MCCESLLYEFDVRFNDYLRSEATAKNAQRQGTRLMGHLAKKCESITIHTFIFYSFELLRQITVLNELRKRV